MLDFEWQIFSIQFWKRGRGGAGLGVRGIVDFRFKGGGEVGVKGGKYPESSKI